MRQPGGKLHEDGRHNPFLRDLPPMHLDLFTLTLEPAEPLQFSLPGLRVYITGKLSEYTLLAQNNNTGFLHRYPAVQCKQLRHTLMVLGISQGATFLEELVRDQDEIKAGINRCTILTRNTAVQKEEFGTGGIPHTYEFLTPWLALNQQNAKKFYELKGKPERDAFMQKILVGNLETLAKSLDLPATMPITCEAKVKFRIDRIERENVIVFLGKFRTNLRIPDYFGIGQSVSKGFGTIRSIPAVPGVDDGEHTK
jgi:hypothetical protein